MPHDRAQAALAYAQRGWHVLPIYEIRADGTCACGQPNAAPKHTPGKHPRTPSGFKDASCDPATVTAWWTTWPDANVAIATGPSDLYVLDFDPKNGGEAGMQTLLNRTGDVVLKSVRARSGSGGGHIYYKRSGRHLGNTGGNLGQGLDTRGEGGYIIAPPSNHISGGTYAWAPGAAPGEVELADIPEALLHELHDAKGRPKKLVPDVIPERIPRGGLNSSILSIAGRLRRSGAPERVILKACFEWNAMAEAPMSERQVRDVVSRYALTGRDFEEKLFIEAGENDMGNAKRLVMRFGHLFRHVPQWGFVVWDGRHWIRDEANQLQEYAKDTACDMRSCVRGIEDDEKRKRFSRWVDTSHSRAKLEAMVALAASDPAINMIPEAFDTHRDLLNVANGIIDLRTGELGPHDPEKYLTSLVDVEYDPAAICPTWIWFVRECATPYATDETKRLVDELLVAYLQRAVGYTMTGHTREQKFFFLYGDGQNGKSVFVHILGKLLGSMAGNLPFDALLMGRDSGRERQHSLATMQGKRLAVAPEAPEGKAFDETAVKALTGEDAVSVRSHYEKPWNLVPQFKLWLTGNNRPEIRGTDPAIWRRPQLIPFQNHVSDGQRDDRLKEKLEAELPGILAWAVRGSMQWAGGKLDPPDKVLDAIREYKEESDAMGRWLDERTRSDPDLITSAADLLRDHNAWAEEAKERELTAQAFGRRMARVRGGIFTKIRIGSGIHAWKGIALGRVAPPPAAGSLEAFQVANPSQHDRLRLVLDVVRRLADKKPRAAHQLDVVEELAKHGLSREDVLGSLATLQRNNTVYQPKGPTSWAPMDWNPGTADAAPPVVTSDAPADGAAPAAPRFRRPAAEASA